MLNESSPQPCGILYVDDEEMALKYFHRAYGAQYPVLTASSADEALQRLESDAADVGIVISDQRMPGMLGSDFLALVRQRHPNKVRILTTAYSDLQSAINAVNKGHIYQYVVKPWEIPELGMILRRAADYHHVLAERDTLLRAKMTVLQRLICGDRLRGLLLGSQTLPAAEALAFRQALGAMILALPGDFPPAPAEGPATEPAGHLLRREYETCTHLLGSFPPPPAAEALENLRAALPAASLDNPDPDLHRLLVPPAAGDDDLPRRLLGLASGGPVTAESRLLLLALSALAGAGARLEITRGPQDPAPLLLDPGQTPADPAELIDALSEKFAQFDIARL